MNLTLHVWRQKSPADEGRMVKYEIRDVNEHASFLEMLDVLNERLVAEGVARGDAARRVAAETGLPRRRLYGGSDVVGS